MDAGRCVATAVGLGLPLLALVPIGLATQLNIPGLTPLVNQVQTQIQQVNTQLQQSLGIFDPYTAGVVNDVNAQLRQYAPYAGHTVAGIALVAAGLLGATALVDNCVPAGESSTGSTTGSTSTSSEAASSESGSSNWLSRIFNRNWFSSN